MFADRYQELAGVTLANKFHGEKMTLAELKKRMRLAIEAGESLDEAKKALFYGRGDDLGLTASIGAVFATEAPGLIAGTFDGRVDAWPVGTAEVMLHMALGKVTEAAEFLEAILKALNGKNPPDRTNLLEEIGDGLWYDANALNYLASTFENEMGRNIDKLRARFPQGFSEHDANKRDLENERQILENFNTAVDGGQTEG